MKVDGERCQRCGDDYREWWAPTDLFEQVRGIATLLCPDCFTALAAEAGERLCWVAYRHVDVHDAIALDTQKAIRDWQKRSATGDADG